MSKDDLFQFSILAIVSLALIGCSISRDNGLKKEEEHLETDGNLAKFHYLVRDPYSIGLSHEGYLIGIEKSPKEKIGFPKKSKNGIGYQDIDDNRFRIWHNSDYPEDDYPDESPYLTARNEHFIRVSKGPKGMFISHILAYGFDSKRTVRFNVLPEYSVYKYNGFVDVPSHQIYLAKNETETTKKLAANSIYEDSWRALDQLKISIETKLNQAQPRYTHILVASMGWNNDQVESVRRYNALLRTAITHARLEGTVEGENFNPLIIGLTWPSVWGGNSFFNTINLISHIGSYPNKADDADEIGYMIANYLVNKIVYSLKSQHKLKIVLIGHSLGARILSRTMFSAHLIREDQCEIEESKGDATDLFIGLQGAFSIRRFKTGFKKPFPFSLFRKEEGSPYLIYKELPGRVVLTSSKHDAANPIAQLFSGARHVGGKAGYKESEKMLDVFERIKWENLFPIKTDLTNQNDAKKWLNYCDNLRNSKKVLMINADEIVQDHNDIIDTQIGRLIWKNISCFTY